MGNPLREVVIKAERAAKTLAVQVAPVGHRAQQVERAQLRERDGRGERHGQRGRAIHKKIRDRQTQRAAPHVGRDAGIEHAASAGIEIGPQLRVVVRRGRELQHGDER